jgi:hypothetical protein
MRIFYNLGNGKLATSKKILISFESYDATTADVNEDDTVYIILAYLFGNITVIFNIGDGVPFIIKQAILVASGHEQTLFVEVVLFFYRFFTYILH